MHCVLEGVTKQLTKAWLSRTGAAFYIGNRTATLDMRLARMRPPHIFSRSTQFLTERALWKAKKIEILADLLCHTASSQDTSTAALCALHTLVRGHISSPAENCPQERYQSCRSAFDTLSSTTVCPVWRSSRDIQHASAYAFAEKCHAARPFVGYISVSV